MARQVNFDPFGSYLQGLRLGQQDEMGLQQATRQARMQDYDFNTLAPLRLQQLQQGIDFDQRANPMRLDALGDQNFATKLGIAGTFGQETGNMDPRAALWGQQYPQVTTPYPEEAGREFVNQDNIFKQMPFLIQQEQMDQRGFDQQADAARSAQYGNDMIMQALISQGNIPPQLLQQLYQRLGAGQPAQQQPDYGLGRGAYPPNTGGAGEQDDGVFTKPPGW